MFRRAAILAIVAVIPDQDLQLLTYVVFNLFFLMLTLGLRPYDGSRMYNVLENFGTSTMVVIAQMLGLASAFPSEKEIISIFIGLVIFFSVLTVLVVGIYLLRANTEPHEELAPPARPYDDPGRGARDPADNVLINSAEQMEQKKEEGAEQVPIPGQVQTSADEAQIDLPAQQGRAAKVEDELQSGH